MSNDSALAIPKTERRSFRRNRLTADYPFGWLTSYSRIVDPEDNETTWRDLDLDTQTLSTVSPNDILSILVDISPDVNRAAWDYCRMFDPGHTITAYHVGYDDEDDRQDYPEAQAALDAFIAETLPKRTPGGITTVMSRIAMSFFLRGALFMEAVVDGRTVIDLATPDPESVRFRVNNDGKGDYWELGQVQGWEFVSLQDAPNVWYVPIDPKPGKPYGRAIAAPGLIPALFLITLLHDVRRIVANQGSPRIDMSIDTKMLREAFPTANEEKFKQIVAQLTDEALDTLSGLQPDDAYGHPDWITMAWAEGALSGVNLQGFEAITKSLEQMLVRGLKSNPLVSGSDDGVSEASSNRQWEMYVETIKSLQRKAGFVLEAALELMLQLAGYQADVVVEFDTIRASEELRDAQVEQTKLANAETSERLGYRSQDEASEYAVGHPPHGTKSAPVVPVDSNADEDDPAAETIDGDEAINAEDANAERQIETRVAKPFVPNAPVGEPPATLPVAVNLSEAAALYDLTFPDEGGVLTAEMSHAA